MFKRLLSPLLNRSFFLFGARSTGKSTFIREQLALKNAKVFDFLKPRLADRFLRDPSLLTAEFAEWETKGTQVDWIVLDEVQKIPELLDVVQDLIESRGTKFVLTGSSSRKLKRGGANLLGGRANVYYLGALSSLELGDRFDLQESLEWGTLPLVIQAKTSRERRSFLLSYSDTYLKEEILQEQVIRRLKPFRNFLEISAQMNAQRLNYLKIAKEVGVDSKTVSSYYDILEETHLGFRLPGFDRSIRKAQKKRPKFYWFDLGVQRHLAAQIHSTLAPSTASYGFAFETWVINEIERVNQYKELGFKLSYFEGDSNSEIDMILSRGNDRIAVEIKSSVNTDDGDVRKLKRLASDVPGIRGIFYLSRDPHAHKMSGVRCLPWYEFLEEVQKI